MAGGRMSTYLHRAPDDGRGALPGCSTMSLQMQAKCVHGIDDIRLFQMVDYTIHSDLDDRLNFIG